MLARACVAYTWELLAVLALLLPWSVSNRIAPDPEVLEVVPVEFGQQVTALTETLKRLEAHTREIAENVKPKTDVVDRITGGENKAWNALRNKGHGPVLLVADVHAGLEDANQRVASVAEDLLLMKDTIESRRAMVRSMPLARPVNGIVTSPFGLRTSPIKGKPQIHEGVDIAAPKGSIVVAPADGEVMAVGQQNGYGYSVELDHGMGIVTVFAHLGRATVKPGDKVKRGQLIAVIGTTGQTTGPHLHYEVRVDGRAVDPQPFLAFDLARAEAITTLGRPKT